jgi:hypothetical protein
VSWRSGLSAAPRALGTIGLAVGAFETGWKIGTGLNAKFLRIGLPDPPEPKVDPANGLLFFEQEGYSSAFNETPLPADGWVLGWSAYSQTWRSVNLSSGWESPCAYLTGPPEGFRVLTGVASVGWCIAPPVPVESYWLAENDLEAAGPIEDYVDQPYARESPAPPPPPQTTVEESIGNQLERPENDLLLQWLNYQLGSPGETDPLGIGPPNAGIEFPGFEKHWRDHEEEFPEYTDPWEYWQGAVDIVERGDRSPAGGEGVQRCERTSGGAVDLIYWDIQKATIVVVKDGKIITYFKPDDADQYWLDNCDD